MKQDNRGITLAELMVALAISMIVITGATYLLSSSQNGYQREKIRIDLQQEAQLASTQISNMLLEATRAEMETGHPVYGKVLRIYGMPSGGSISFNEVYMKDFRLYLNQGVSGGAVSGGGIVYAYTEGQLLADYVNSFDYTEEIPNPVSGKRLGTLKLEMKEDTGTFRMENQVMLRNSSN